MQIIFQYALCFFRQLLIKILLMKVLQHISIQYTKYVNCTVVASQPIMTIHSKFRIIMTIPK